MALIRRHPLFTYFLLVFAISWGGILLIVGPGGLPGRAEAFERLIPLAVPALLAGPALVGLALIGVMSGPAGYRDLLTRLLRWRVGAPWYVIALLTAPVVMTAVLLGLSTTSPRFLPGIVATADRTSLLAAGLLTGMAAGIFEEIGWSGFAIPALRRRHGVLATGLIVGLLWATWHLIVAYWASGMFPGALALASFLLDPFLFLVGFRVLMVAVYDRTQSLSLAMLMHMSLTASARIIGNMTMAGWPLLMSDAIWAVAISAVAWRVFRSPR